MLAETAYNQDPSVGYPSEQPISKRVMDVRRGADYYKKLDNLAQTQWRSNMPQLPAVSRKVSLLPKITTSVLSEPDINLQRNTILNMTSTPRQSFSMMSTGDNTYTSYSLTNPNSQMSLPASLSRSKQFVSPHSPFVEGSDNRAFNTWGTSHSPLEDETKLTSEDMRPRELPFRFRDSRKLVVKPTPRKSMPMSRVAGTDRNRHQRTVTNFRSRNGTIRIIRPLDPLPEIEKFQKNYNTEAAFDVENIEREKTFQMLERIDKILHPNKRYSQRNIGSSEEEIPGTSDSSVTITQDNDKSREPSDLTPRFIASKNSRSPRISPRYDNHLKSRRDNNKSGRAQSRQRVRFTEDPFGLLRTPRTFSGVLQSLEASLQDVDSKCRSWINDTGDDALMYSSN